VGGVDADYSEFDVVIRGRDQSPVILQELRVVVWERRAPLTGIHVTYRAEAKKKARKAVMPKRVRVELDPDVDPDRNKRLDLDQSFNPNPYSSQPYTPRAKIFPGEKQLGQEDYRLSVSATDIEILHFSVNTAMCYCVWTVELRYAASNKLGSAIIDNNGQPFRTTASGKAVKYASWDGKTFRGPDAPGVRQRR
jgi:hypothetical protein